MVRIQTMKEFKETPLGVQIRKTDQVIKSYIDDYLDKHMVDNLYAIESLTLRFISRHDKKVSAGDVINRFNISKATASETLHRLEKKKLITMSSDKEDCRKKVLTLTEKGKIASKQLDEIFNELNKHIESCLDDDEKETLSSLLLKVFNNLNDMGGK